MRLYRFPRDSLPIFALAVRISTYFSLHRAIKFIVANSGPAERIILINPLGRPHPDFDVLYLRTGNGHVWISFEIKSTHRIAGSVRAAWRMRTPCIGWRLSRAFL